MKTLKVWIWISVAVMIILVLLYFIQFNGKLSNDKTDWGTFGDYLSGVFGLFNMVLFAFLTWYIFKSEEERSERELGVQRKIIITQLRYSEFNRLDTELEKILTIESLNDYQAVADLVRNVTMSIETFRVHAAYLFPLINEKAGIRQFGQIVDLMTSIVTRYQVGKDVIGITTFQAYRGNLRKLINEFILNDLKG